MRDYELMTIHRPELAEDDIESKVGELESYLSNAGCSVTKRDLWGKRRFAYEIDLIGQRQHPVQGVDGFGFGLEVEHRVVTLGDVVDLVGSAIFPVPWE